MVVSLLALSASLSTAQAAGTAITVTTTQQGVNTDDKCSLQEAIYAANLDASKAPDPAHPTDPNAFIQTACAAGNGPETIFLPEKATFFVSTPVADADNYVGATATPMVRSKIVLEAQGARLERVFGAERFRAFAVGARGELILHEIHVKGFEVRGGNGADGGGGGMGAGGAVYVQGGTLRVGWSTFERNGARGGDGSPGVFGGSGGGGGGGLGGNGGTGKEGGGGGGGARGNSAAGAEPGCLNVCLGGAAGGGGGGTLKHGERSDGGYRCGGDGGKSTLGGEDGDSGECAGGGGGGGEEAILLPSPLGGDGGTGNYGGGSGGGAYRFESGDGGLGGFGGGGGGANTSGTNVSGFGPAVGDGGFGGGGGAAAGGFVTGEPGEGGTFGGNASDKAGGGGAGLGGAIFGDQSTIEIRNSTFFGNYAHRGESGGEGASDGRAAGGALFLVAGSLFVNNSTFSNNQTGEFTIGTGGLGGGGIVVYKPTTGEATSLTLRNSILAGNGPHECYLRNGPAASGVGNLITHNLPNIRNDTPCPGVKTSSDPNLGPLGLNAPGRTPTMRIPLGSPAADAADSATAEPDDQRGVSRPQGAGDDIGAYEVVDEAPVTTITLDPASPNGSNGWYTSAVGVTVSATDDGTVAETRCARFDASAAAPASFDALPACTLASVGSDGQHVVYAASKDTAGNTEWPPTSASFKIDRTAPSLSPTLSSSVVVIGQSGVAASPNATDATSGVASASCGAVDTASPGVKTVTCTATDNAGNSASVDLTYVVEYRILGFFEPVPLSKWRVGQTVPVKAALGDGAGVRISDAEAVALVAGPCRVKFSATGAQTKGPQCMRYDADKDQFVYAWRLGKSGTGPATIHVVVSYAGTTHTTEKTLQIVITPDPPSAGSEARELARLKPERRSPAKEADVPEFLLEMYVAREGSTHAARLARRARSTVAELTDEGVPVRLVRSIFVPEDETCFLLFEAETVEAVEEAARRAELPYERVSEAVAER
ncbi:MAG TPA: nickel-binding protein [Gaiellaceae bacterium]|nr:nickel-binding protein [Gaiellaceae bacterium]